MSADNWAKCPRCAKRSETALLAREQEVARLYGKVSVEAFDQARQDLADRRSDVENQDPTFREDYEIYGAAHGVVEVSYSGRCGECGLSLEFQHEHPLDVDGAS